MKFPHAVAASALLKDHFKVGLGALGTNSSRITTRDTRKITGSVNIEAAQREVSGQHAAWDYGIGFAPSKDDIVIWVEIHSADTRHVQVVLDKLDSLLSLLEAHAPTLGALPRRFVWLATGAVYISPNSPEKRRLESRGMLLRSKRLNLESVL